MSHHHTLPPLLSADQESRLAGTIEAGLLAAHHLASGECPVAASSDELRRLEAEGHLAWQHFLLANVRLVWREVRRCGRGSGLSDEELFQEGFLALAGALQRFDHTRARFSTFATPRLRQHLSAVAASRLGGLGIPMGRAVELRHANRLAAELAQELGRPPAVAELAQALGRSPGHVALLLSHRPPVPLDGQLEVVGALASFDPPSEETEDERGVVGVLAGLALDEHQVLAFRFGFIDGESHTCREVAARLGTSVSSVRRIEQRALANVRRRLLPGGAARTALTG
ncbi:MAG: sigma-70 family RNA polymerase sigma factor [Propionicimonas sp.]